MAEEDVVIVGAGIAGLATAVALKRVGIRALVLERSDGLRATGAALTLFPNAWVALDALDVAHKLTPHYVAHTRWKALSSSIYFPSYFSGIHAAYIINKH